MRTRAFHHNSSCEVAPPNAFPAYDLELFEVHYPVAIPVGLTHKTLTVTNGKVDAQGNPQRDLELLRIKKAIATGVKLFKHAQ
eukprot:CAMPEP_0172907984 /NCGR_PEP_ID=MMETSP1075-20121228/179868_1 /TAXON_ID=2916 /ORGANISM="Ceratium fusus, Strain PA161109" /LENGTH=82 /DNA_ID=CAMNT_0013765685 /DNA_START=79 /DNA_END=327 /DNA_ORIENTATION=+